MNPFQVEYNYRLQEWKCLRLEILGQGTETACINVDRWWQQAPLINHHLHPLDTNNWPDPWTILSENTYCTLTRAIGMCYTLLMSSFSEIKLVQATDEYGDEYNLVIVGFAKYILNYHPDTVISNSFENFKILRELTLEPLQKNIR